MLRQTIASINRIVALCILAGGARTEGAVPFEKNELFVWGQTRLQMVPTRPVVGISAGGGASFAFQDDGQVATWGVPLRMPDVSLRGATKIVAYPSSGFTSSGLAALMKDGTLRSSSSELNRLRRVMDIVGRGGRFAVLDSDHVAMTYDKGWRDTVRGIRSVACTFDSVWYLRDDGVVVHRGVAQPNRGTFRKLAGGNWHVAGLRNDSTVSVWGGESRHQQALVPAGLSGVVDIQAGWCHTMVLRKDGSVESWGIPCPGAFSCPTSLSDDALPCDNPTSKSSVHPPASLGKVRSIAAGDNHSMALLQDGQIVSWGDSTDRAAIVPEGRSDVADLEAEQQSIVVLHKNGTLSIGSVASGSLRWGSLSAPDARGLRTISGARDPHFALDSAGVLHGWTGKGESIALPEEVLTAEKRNVAFVNKNIKSISFGEKLALQTSEGRLLLLGNDGVFTEAAIETRSARQIKSANRHVYALQSNGTVVRFAEASPDTVDVLPWTKIRRLFGGRTILVGQDTQGGSFFDVDSILFPRWSARASGPSDLKSWPPLASLDADSYGMIGVDSAGHVVSWGESNGPFWLPAEVPPLRQVASGLYYGFGIIAPGPLHATASLPKPNQGLVPGRYPARLFDPRGIFLWEGQATWTGSGWRIPSAHAGLAVLNARTPWGTRSERIFLAR